MLQDLEGEKAAGIFRALFDDAGTLERHCLIRFALECYRRKSRNLVPLVILR